MLATRVRAAPAARRQSVLRNVVPPTWSLLRRLATNRTTVAELCTRCHKRQSSRDAQYSARPADIARHRLRCADERLRKQVPERALLRRRPIPACRGRLSAGSGRDRTSGSYTLLAFECQEHLANVMRAA